MSGCRGGVLLDAGLEMFTFIFDTDLYLHVQKNSGTLDTLYSPK